jgi:hypothetical protein
MVCTILIISRLLVVCNRGNPPLRRPSSGNSYTSSSQKVFHIDKNPEIPLETAKIT